MNIYGGDQIYGNALVRSDAHVSNFGVSDAHVGNLAAFLLGLPFGALGGYFYRGWRDEHPGKWAPGISGDYSVGGPWVDLAGPSVGAQDPYVGGPGPYVGAPWLDLVGPYVGAQGPYVGNPYVGNLYAGNLYAGNLYAGDPYDGGPAPYVGAPWLDLAGPSVGGPWLDVVGAELGPRERRLAWLQTRALIESAKREASNAQATAPAAAWVWSLDPTGLPPGTGAELTSSQLTPFSSLEQAQAYMLERIHTPHVALALFDPTAVRHWPNPVRWAKNDAPAYEPLIAQRAAQFVPERVSGEHVGTTAIGTAIGDVRSRAQALANKRVGSVVGVIHTTKDNLWHALAFRNVDDADDWIETQDQAAFTYAAYFDKGDAAWPNAVIEKIGGFRAPKISGALVGASVLDDTRMHAKSLASAKQGNAAGVVRSEDGTWFTYAFPNLDAAIDWLSGMTFYRKSFTYAAAFEKGADGTAYIQQEEFGAHPVPPLRRAISATSGEQSWWSP